MKIRITFGMVLSLMGNVEGFLEQTRPHLPSSMVVQTKSRPTAFLPPKSTFAAGDEDGIGEFDPTGQRFMEALRSRQEELQSKQQDYEKKWHEADCASGIRVNLPDYVRRLSVEYPLAACGTASGSIYLAHLESGELLAQGIRPDEIIENTKIDNLEKSLFHLYGENDGGGTVAIAFDGDLIAESNRDGGVHLWRLDPGSTRLVYQGSMSAMDGVLVTCLHLDEEFLWVGSADGKLQAFPLEADLPLALQKYPELEWQFRSMILSLSLTPDIGCGVVTTSEGTVELISLEADGRSLCTFYPPYDDDEDEDAPVHPLSAVLVAHKVNADGFTPYSIAVGGNDGSLILQPLQLDEDGEIDEFRPFLGSLNRFKPLHQGPVKCLANPIPGVLVSGSHDGSIRVWDVAKSRCSYQFVGYKVWLGSLWTDGARIVSDGSDNTVIVHDFDKSADAPPKDIEEDFA